MKRFKMTVDVFAGAPLKGKKYPSKLSRQKWKM